MQTSPSSRLPSVLPSCLWLSPIHLGTFACTIPFVECPPSSLRDFHVPFNILPSVTSEKHFPGFLPCFHSPCLSGSCVALVIVLCDLYRQGFVLSSLGTQVMAE